MITGKRVKRGISTNPVEQIRTTYTSSMVPTFSKRKTSAQLIKADDMNPDVVGDSLQLVYFRKHGTMKTAAFQMLTIKKHRFTMPQDPLIQQGKCSVCRLERSEVHVDDTMELVGYNLYGRWTHFHLGKDVYGLTANAMYIQNCDIQLRTTVLHGINFLFPSTVTTTTEGPGKNEDRGQARRLPWRSAGARSQPMNDGQRRERENGPF